MALLQTKNIQTLKPRLKRFIWLNYDFIFLVEIFCYQHSNILHVTVVCGTLSCAVLGVRGSGRGVRTPMKDINFWNLQSKITKKIYHRNSPPPLSNWNIPRPEKKSEFAHDCYGLGSLMIKLPFKVAGILVSIPDQVICFPCFLVFMFSTKWIYLYSYFYCRSQQGFLG